MNRHLIVIVFLTTALICSAADNGDRVGIFQKRQTYIYCQLVKQLGLVDIGHKHDRKFAQNLKFIHAIVPSGLLFYSADMRPDDACRFVIVAVGDWKRTMATGTIHCDDSLEGCMHSLAWRFAGITMPFKLSNLKASNLWGDLCIVDSDFNEMARLYPTPRSIELFRNGIWISLSIKDASMTSYPQFLDALDALLCHDPDKPFVPPAGFSEAEYQKNLAKYQAWLKEKEKKENERRERELAKRRAAAAQPLARPQRPFFAWNDEITAPGQAFMRKFFPDSPAELGTWRAEYAARADNPLNKRFTAKNLQGRFPIVSPLGSSGTRDDFFRVCLGSRDGKERYAVAVLHARSAPEAREALALLCLTAGDIPGARPRDAMPPRFRKRADLGIGEFCVGNQGEVREDGTVLPRSDEQEIFFMRGNTAVMVRVLPDALGNPTVPPPPVPATSAVALAKWVDKLLADAMGAGE